MTTATPGADDAPKAHVQRDYTAAGIVVHWDSSRCIHSANCIDGLPEVFDVRRRPWIRVDAADTDRIAHVVDTCPSRALTYTRLDGMSAGPNGAPTTTADQPDTEPGTAVIISLKPDGPLLVEGPVRIEMARGEVIDTTDRAALCRCGQSGNKPFCDGSHKKAGFTAAGW